MIRLLLKACVRVALFGALTVPAFVSGKPPDLPEDGTFTVKPARSQPAPAIELLPMPREESDVTCPYLRQQMIDRHVGQSANPTMGREVLDNLERLKEADELMELAKYLARVGSFALAKECCRGAAELCPGSHCAERAAEIMQQLERIVASPTKGSEEAAEPPTCPYCGKTGKPIREIVPEKRKYDSDKPNSSSSEYEFEVGVNDQHRLRLNANCTLSTNVYHLSYKDGCLKIWKTPDAGKTKP
jgi:hypothetical protein